MRYLAMVADYGGTLASDGVMSEETARAVKRLRVTGRQAILVTSLELGALTRSCPYLSHFNLVVAENGGILYDPASREETQLALAASEPLVRALRQRGVEPLKVGRVRIATDSSHRETVQDVLWELGLEAQVIGNRGAVLILPAGVNKATGLARALRKLGLSRHEVVGIGDAENDHSFLEMCECAVAVADAVPSLKEASALVTQAGGSAGVIKLISELIEDDLKRAEGRLPQHLIPFGKGPDGTPIWLPPYGHTLLVAGPSGSGKSTFTSGLIERLIEKNYQVCIIDPEGDYGSLRDVVALGNPWRTPSIHEILAILEDPDIHLSVNLLGLPLNDRPAFLAQLLPNLQAMRSRTGRPHWLVLDEAHHMLPRTWGHAPSTFPQQLGETIFVTVHPDHITPAVLEPIQIAVAVGPDPEQTLATFGKAAGAALSWPEGLSYQRDRVVSWFVGEGRPPVSMIPIPGRAERIRHRRKYAEGDLRWHSFYFRGPHCRHNLKAQNLAIFCQIAEGIDEETWTYHLRRGDYSRWFRHAVRDNYMADEAQRVEGRTDLDAWQTRRMITELVNARYTLAE